MNYSNPNNGFPGNYQLPGGQPQQQYQPAHSQGQGVFGQIQPQQYGQMQQRQPQNYATQGYNTTGGYYGTTGTTMNPYATSTTPTSATQYSPYQTHNQTTGYSTNSPSGMNSMGGQGVGVFQSYNMGQTAQQHQQPQHQHQQHQQQQQQQQQQSQQQPQHSVQQRQHQQSAVPQFDWPQASPSPVQMHNNIVQQRQNPYSPQSLAQHVTPSVSGNNVTAGYTSQSIPTSYHQQAMTLPSPVLQTRVSLAQHHSPSPTQQAQQIHNYQQQPRAQSNPAQSPVTVASVSPYQRQSPQIQVRVQNSGIPHQGTVSSPVGQFKNPPLVNPQQMRRQSSTGRSVGQSSPLVNSTTIGGAERNSVSVDQRRVSGTVPVKTPVHTHSQMQIPQHKPPQAVAPQSTVKAQNVQAPKPPPVHHQIKPPVPQTTAPQPTPQPVQAPVPIPAPELEPEPLPPPPPPQFHEPELPQTINPADIFGAPSFMRYSRPSALSYQLPEPEPKVEEPKKEEVISTKQEPKEKDVMPPAKKQKTLGTSPKLPKQAKQPSNQSAPEFPAVVVPGNYLHSAPQQSYGSLQNTSTSSKGHANQSDILATSEQDQEAERKLEAQKLEKEKKKNKGPAHDAHVRYDAVLIGLSNEYIDAAYKLGPRVARIGGEVVDEAEKALVEEYQSLIAAGLGCMEAALKNFKYVPAVEASLMQRYATVMFEETENWDEMEAVLSKGISLCDRNKLWDQKYSMAHLLARILGSRKPTAALKALDKSIKEVEQKNQTPWEYALRFLHITLSLERGTHHDVVVALQHLRAISDLAEKYGDKCVFVYAASIEALAYIHTESVDAVTNAQDSIARARSLQMDRSTQSIQPVWYFLNCIDLICSLLRYEGAEVIAQKMEAIHAIANQNPFTRDGSLTVPLGSKSAKSVLEFGGKVFVKEKQSGENEEPKVSMQFHWLPDVGVYALACLLSTCTGVLKMAGEKKNTKFVHEGLSTLKNYITRDPDKDSKEMQSRSTVQSRLKAIYELRWYTNLYQAILLCIHCKWTLAKRVLEELESEMQSNEGLKCEAFERWTIYVKAMIEQGTGNVDAAATLYRSPILLVPSSTSSGAATSRLLGTAAYDLSVLARLNLLFILRDPTIPDFESSNILADLESRLLPPEHPSSALHIALDLNRALNTPSSAILAKKKPLQNALVRASKGSPQNDQLSCVAMGAMVHLFFKEMLSGDGQAAKSRETLMKLAVRLGSPVWMSMAKGMMLEGGVVMSDEERRKGQEEIVEWNSEMRGEGVSGQFLN